MLNLLIALDQLAYVLITLGHGDPDETMSSAAWRMERQGRFFGFTRPLIDGLFRPLEKDHCRKAWESEQNEHNGKSWTCL